MKALVVTLGLLAAAPALAANADTPDRNVDKGNDAGGPTRNDQVDRLNKRQLDESQRPSPSSQSPPPSPSEPPAQDDPMAKSLPGSAPEAARPTGRARA